MDLSTTKNMGTMAWKGNLMCKLAKKLFNERCSVCEKKLGLTSNSFLNKKKFYCQECYDVMIEKGEIIPPFHYKISSKE